ncbi:hypothetical protein AB0M47_17455 [Hamadaea sp. NPDC051192]|uniref:coiled-coil domain-containing protein n=1 Tax=Hamadaea sp. NPDC051192 TaxID=3154940 RepID=UPI003415A483
MTLAALPRRWLAPVLALVVAVTLFVTPSGAYAEPDEGGNATQLIQNIEAASRGYLEAQDGLEASQYKQAALQKELVQVNAELTPLRKEVAAIAVEAYTNGRLTTIGAMLSASSSDSFLERATMLEEMNYREDDSLRKLTRLESKAKADKEAIDAEAAIQKAQKAEMKKRLDALELTLSKSGGRKAATGWLKIPAPKAIPTKRNADGSLPSESANVKDPTGTGGKITPRTKHALDEAKRVGFTRFTKCWRTQSWGEHPKGRACDYSVSVGGFEGVPNSSERIYGDKLAAFFIQNARALGVLYVIWYRMIWTPGAGWHNYSGCCGAAAEHQNHVHLSMY